MNWNCNATSQCTIEVLLVPRQLTSHIAFRSPEKEHVLHLALRTVANGEAQIVFASLV